MIFNEIATKVSARRLIFLMFIFERQKEYVSGEREREREAQNLKQAPAC